MQLLNPGRFGVAGEVCRDVSGRAVCSWEQKHLVLSEDDFKFVPDDVTELSDDAVDYNRPIHPPRYPVYHPPLPEVCSVNNSLI